MRIRVFCWVAACAALLYGCRPVDVGRELRSARQAASEGKWQEALATVNNCLAEVPGNVDATAFKSLCLFKTSPTDNVVTEQALELIGQAIALAPDRYDFQLIQGWELLQLNRTREAMTPLRQAYELHLRKENAAQVPQQVQGTIKYLLGECCYRNRLYDEAARYLEQSLASEPYSKWAMLHNNLAVANVFSGNLNGAMGWITKAQKLAQKDVAVNLNMAIVCDWMSNPRYNQSSAAQFKAVTPNWYAYAQRLAKENATAAPNMSWKVFYDNLEQGIVRRREELLLQ